MQKWQESGVKNRGSQCLLSTIPLYCIDEMFLGRIDRAHLVKILALGMRTQRTRFCTVFCASEISISRILGNNYLVKHV